MRAHKLKLGRVALIATMLLAVAPSAYAYTERVAVLIGVEQYERGQGRGIFRDLPFSINDLEAVAMALEEIGFDPIYVYSDAEAPAGSAFQYRSLLPTGALTVGAGHIDRIISDVLDHLQQKQDALLFVYFTGHGGAFRGMDGVLAGRVLALPDSKLHVPSSFSHVRRILEEMAVKAPQVDKMLVIDACADQLGSSRPYAVTMGPERLPVHLYSSSLGQKSFFDPRLEMSVFSLHLVEALKRADSLGNGDVDGDIESEEIENWVRHKVPAHSRKKQKKNLPDDTAAKQEPWGSGGKNLVLGPSPSRESFLSRKQGESKKDWEARRTGFRRAFYFY